MEVEIRVMLPQAKECLGLEEARKDRTQRARKEHDPANVTLDFGPLLFRTMRE